MLPSAAQLKSPLTFPLALVALISLTFILTPSLPTTSILSTESLPAESSVAPAYPDLQAHLTTSCRSPSWKKPWDQRISAAYLITAHDNKTIDGLAELVAQIYSPDDAFVIHLDAKVPDSTYDSIVASIPPKCTNIRFTTERIDVKWAGWSIVEAELQLIQDAFEIKTVPWTTAMLLDGSSWPLTTARQRQKWLLSIPKDSSSAAEGPVYTPCSIDKTTGEMRDWGACMRTGARCVESADKVCSRMTGTPNGGLIYKTGQWARMSRDFLQYTLSDPHAQEWKEFFKWTNFPDESFFITLLHNSPFAQTATTDLHLYTDWANTWKCRSYMNYRPGGSPCQLGDWDLEDLTTSISERYIFARKFAAGDKVKGKIMDAAKEKELKEGWFKKTVSPG